MYVPHHPSVDTPPDEDTPDDRERRAIKRRHLIYYLRVWNRDTRDMLGHLVDLTTGGLMLISEHPIPLKQTFNLEMRWHDPEAGEQIAEFRAQSLWSRPDVNPAFQDTGFMLLDQTPEVLIRIQELIGRLGFHD